jgi:hypothetical protein
MEKRTLVIIASVSVVAAIGAYFYFTSKKKEREKVYETIVVEDDVVEDDVVEDDVVEEDIDVDNSGDVQWSQYGAVSVREDIF